MDKKHNKKTKDTISKERSSMNNTKRILENATATSICIDPNAEYS